MGVLVRREVGVESRVKNWLDSETVRGRALWILTKGDLHKRPAISVDRNRSREDEPVILVRGFIAGERVRDRDSTDFPIYPSCLPAADRSCPLDIRPLHRLDVSQEEKIRGREHLLQARGESVPVALIGGSRDLYDGLVSSSTPYRFAGLRPEVADDREVFRSRVDSRSVRERIDGLESESETADVVKILGALADSADALHIRSVERISEMSEPETTFRQLEGNASLGLRRFSGLTGPARKGILGVLEQLEEEVSRVVVLLVEDPFAPVGGGLPEFILPACPDRIVVAGAAGVLLLHRPPVRSGSWRR